MSTDVRNPSREEVLADTHETLRAVARTLESLGTVGDLAPGSVLEDEADDRAEPSPGPAPTLGMGLQQEELRTPLQRLALFLAESYGELAGILEGLRETRGVLQRAEVTRLQHMNATLQEVSSHTEMATTDMLDGLERSLALVDELELISIEAPDEGTVNGAQSNGAHPPATDPEDTRDRLRDELHQIMQHLQFQDITSQRIGHASDVLADVEQRLVLLMGTLERYGFVIPEGDDEPGEATPTGAHAETCDPSATTADAESRQAMADDIFG
ncbi:MAG: hypothetical protein EA422_00255 [Gemmatimonadales bacterium]|nr:MAG: hypothetical protein EA422_00255 [Gemmatimonadales bacterium]